MNSALRKKEGFAPQTCSRHAWITKLHGKAVGGQTLRPQADTGAFLSLILRAYEASVSREDAPDFSIFILQLLILIRKLKVRFFLKVKVVKYYVLVFQFTI